MAGSRPAPGAVEDGRALVVVRVHRVSAHHGGGRGARHDRGSVVADVVDAVVARDVRGRPEVLGELRVVEDAMVERAADPAYLLQEHPRVGRPQLAVPCRGPGDERVDVRRDPGDELARGRDVLVHVLVGDVDRGVTLVRLPAGEQLVHDHAGGVHVRAGVGLAVHDELGGEVGHRADQDAAGRGVLGLGADRAGQAEVGDLDPAVVGEEDVLRLHVAVDHPRLVCRGEGREHRLHQRERLPRGHRGLLADQVAQGVAGDVLHGQEDRAVVVALVEHRHHVGVGEPRGRARLADEACREVVVVAEAGVHHLEGAHPVQSKVGGLVYGRHAAASDAGADAVPAVEHTPDQRVRPVPVQHESFRRSAGEGVGPASTSDFTDWCHPCRIPA